jgi:hypothetical protein
VPSELFLSALLTEIPHRCALPWPAVSGAAPRPPLAESDAGSVPLAAPYVSSTTLAPGLYFFSRFFVGDYCCELLGSSAGARAAHAGERVLLLAVPRRRLSRCVGRGPAATEAAALPGTAAPRGIRGLFFLFIFVRFSLGRSVASSLPHSRNWAARSLSSFPGRRMAWGVLRRLCSSGRKSSGMVRIRLIDLPWQSRRGPIYHGSRVLGSRALGTILLSDRGVRHHCLGGELYFSWEQDWMFHL